MRGIVVVQILRQREGKKRGIVTLNDCAPLVPRWAWMESAGRQEMSGLSQAVTESPGDRGSRPPHYYKVSETL